MAVLHVFEGNMLRVRVPVACPCTWVCVASPPFTLGKNRLNLDLLLIFKHSPDAVGRGYVFVLLLSSTLHRHPYVTNSPHPLRFFANSRTLMRCTDPLRRGVGAPHQCPLESVACHVMLTCGFTFR